MSDVRKLLLAISLPSFKFRKNVQTLSGEIWRNLGDAAPFCIFIQYAGRSSWLKTLCLPITRVIPVLWAESVVYHKCENLLSTKSIDSCIVSIDSYWSKAALHSRSTIILCSINSVDSTGSNFEMWTSKYEQTQK